MACPACISGTLHVGTPEGIIQTLHGLPTYVATPPISVAKGTVVIIPDSFGWQFNNNRILADVLAKKGNFRILLPDFMAGKNLSQDALPYMDKILTKHESFGLHSLINVWYMIKVMTMFVPFIIGCPFSVTHPRVLAYMKNLREEDESHSVGVAGYCWGSKHVFFHSLMIKSKLPVGNR